MENSPPGIQTMPFGAGDGGGCGLGIVGPKASPESDGEPACTVGILEEWRIRKHEHARATGRQSDMANREIGLRVRLDERKRIEVFVGGTDFLGKLLTVTFLQIRIPSHIIQSRCDSGMAKRRRMKL